MWRHRLVSTFEAWCDCHTTTFFSHKLREFDPQDNTHVHSTHVDERWDSLVDMVISKKEYNVSLTSSVDKRFRHHVTSDKQVVWEFLTTNSGPTEGSTVRQQPLLTMSGSTLYNGWTASWLDSHLPNLVPLRWKTHEDREDTRWSHPVHPWWSNEGRNSER